MSWDSYIDNLIAQSQSQIDQAAIVGLNGGKWTTDNHPNVFSLIRLLCPALRLLRIVVWSYQALKLNPEEMSTLCSNLNNLSYFQQHGVLIDSVKYQYLRGEPGGQILGKKKGLGGITVQPSKSGWFVSVAYLVCTSVTCVHNMILF